MVVAPKNAAAYISLFLACTISTINRTNKVSPETKKNMPQKPGIRRFSPPEKVKISGASATKKVNRRNEMTGLKIFNLLMI
jgi:hypothetical protein